MPVLEATMRAELINSVLPEKVTSMAMQKGALKVHELLFLTFQTFLPSEPSARVDGLNTVESPLKAAKKFAEALSTLRTWRQQVVIVVTDLKANPEPNAVGKGGRRERGSLRVEEKERRGQYVRSISQIKDVLKETNVPMLTPERQANV